MASKSYSSADIRNICLVGHGFCGKTSIAEALLFNAGATTRLGASGSGTSTLDFEPEEHKRGGSIATAFAWLEHDEHKVNVIDTPGDGNFIFDAFTSMRGADAAVVVISARDGIEVQTERVYHHAERLGLARIVVINKMDQERADHETTLLEIEDSFGMKPVPLQVPIGSEGAFSGVVSLMQRKALNYSRDGSGEYTKGEVPAELQGAVDLAWENLVETVASTDEALLEKYLDSFELSEEEVKAGFRAALKKGEILPVLYTSATANIGVHALADLISWGVPSPLDRGDLEATRDGDLVELSVSEEGPFYAQVVKTFMDEFSGKLSIFRVFSGSSPSDGGVTNTTLGEVERLGALYSLRGKEREAVPGAVAGDIVAVAKLKVTRTNHTLAAQGERTALAVETYPPPMMNYTLLPAGKGDEDKMKVSIERLIDEDPTLSTAYDELSHRVVLRGMGQAHLDLSVEKMRRKFKVDVSTDLPAVPYRETIRRAVKHVEGKHKKQTGGAGQYGVCILDVEPLVNGGGFEFEDQIFGGSIPRQYVPSVEKGVRARMARGHLAGYPIIDIKVALKDGKYHPVDSKDVAFQMAGSKGLQAALQKGGVKLLEPIYNMEIVVPSGSMGDIMGDITGRRGRVMGMETKGKKTVITAAAPLAEIQRYAPDLRSMTGGQGTFTMAFSAYEEVPGNLVEGVVKASPYRRDDDE